MARFFDGVIVYCHTFQIASGITHSFSKIFSNKTLILIRPAKKTIGPNPWFFKGFQGIPKDSKGFQRIPKDSKGYLIGYLIGFHCQKDNFMECHTD